MFVHFLSSSSSNFSKVLKGTMSCGIISIGHVRYLIFISPLLSIPYLHDRFLCLLYELYFTILSGKSIYFMTKILIYSCLRRKVHRIVNLQGGGTLDWKINFVFDQEHFLWTKSRRPTTDGTLGNLFVIFYEINDACWNWYKLSRFCIGSTTNSKAIISKRTTKL